MAYPGFQRGGCLRSGPIRKVGGGGGGGGGGASGPIYEKWGWGRGMSTSGPIYEKCGGGGGGGQSASGPIPLFGTQKISTCTYLRTIFTRARE